MHMCPRAFSRPWVWAKAIASNAMVSKLLVRSHKTAAALEGVNLCIRFVLRGDACVSSG